MPHREIETNVITRSDEGEFHIEKLRVKFGPAHYKVNHLVGTNGRNTDLNDVLDNAFNAAQIDMPGRVMCQIGDGTPIDSYTKHYITLPIALSIMQLIGIAKQNAFDGYVIVGSLDIFGNVYAPGDVEMGAIKAAAAAQNLKVITASSASPDTAIDSLKGLVKP